MLLHTNTALKIVNEDLSFCSIEFFNLTVNLACNAKMSKACKVAQRQREITRLLSWVSKKPA